MTTKEELLEQRQPVDHKGRRIIVERSGPNRAERRKAKAQQRRDEAKQRRRDKAKRRKTRRKR